MRLQIIVQDQSVRLMFSRHVRRASNFRPVFAALSRDFRRIMVRQFDTEGGYLSGGWAPLSEHTILSKERSGGDSGILHRTKALRKSLTMGRSGYRQIGAGTFRLGSSLPYAGFHQDGTSGMPRRPLFEFTPTITLRWTKAFQLYLERGIVNLRQLDLV